MSYELTLILVRHGETLWNAEGRFQGARDIPLSEVGTAQAEVLRERFASVWHLSPPPLPGPPVALFASDLSRAFETARIIGEQLPIALTPTAVPLLRERSYGSWEGLTAADIKARFGTSTHAPDAEPWDAVYIRINQALTILWNETLTGREKAVALVVGHGASLKMFFARALGVGPEPMRRIQMDNTGVSIVTFRGSSPDTAESRVLLINDTSHLIGSGFAERPRATPPR